MKYIETYQITKDGGMPDESRLRFVEFLKKNSGKFVEHSTTTDRKRTRPQDKYFFGVMLPCIVEHRRELGYWEDVKQWYDFFVSEGYFGYKEFNGKLVPKHLSEATIIDFIEAKDKIQMMFAKEGCIIPDPQQKEFLERK